ncbi:nuclear pore glycoprotein p62-like [Diaphorina citri]|uniref:Nuclear pore glycoprotein p62-like n=1 Tax=Diaphorina citri TaxID=121845 RepID=A0A1S3DPH0_DIACI|nr:nuclear pore glycoprotein p62-like [Diaphorina citri]KAI5702004.1 hypothetical protein M8J75_015656 [Diaphorina citri]KAI5730539.1 hypothetical protein M8J76_014847 [Diaphorina citri]KAI5733973.1 hypothetical protein M8J77_000945 [Diaphorina citri]
MSSNKEAEDLGEMTSQDVEERLNQWKNNIDAIKRSYMTEAIHIGDVESRLDLAQHKLYNWIANIKLMQEKQKLLSQELDFINERQTELTQEVNKIQVPDDERGSDTSIATTVDDINEKLASLNMEISKRSSDDVNDPKIVIAKILNAQLSSLDILSQRIGQIRRDMETIDDDYYDGYENEIGKVFQH